MIRLKLFTIFFIGILISAVFGVGVVSLRAEEAVPVESVTQADNQTITQLDSDNDGYPDSLEIKNGWSPFTSEPVKISESDVDHDGLSDELEIKFKTNPRLADTDGDGYSDFAELDNAFDPLSTSTKKLAQKVEITLKTQKLAYYVAGEKWKEFTVSTGKPSMPTPTGKFTVVNKIKKAWSKTYSLWMPFWLGLDRGGIGIHELPVWPSGYREGENHLGKPVSHGCVRLGIGPAQYLFDRVDVGLPVFISE